MFNGDYSLVSKVPKNVEETVWVGKVGKECVGPRLMPDEVWLMYRLVYDQYWLLGRHSHLL